MGSKIKKLYKQVNDQKTIAMHHKIKLIKDANYI